jgi:hypothetical protein
MMKNILRASLILLGLVSMFLPGACGQQGESTCQGQLPGELLTEIKQAFPNSKIEETTDLSPEYREMWVKAHSSQCPGVAEGKYKGPDQKLFAVLLLSTEREKPGVTLVFVDLAASGNKRFKVLETVKIATTGPNVIFTLPPGQYSDPEGLHKTRTRFDGVVLEQLEAGSLLYYYRAGAFHKLTLSE